MNVHEYHSKLQNIVAAREAGQITEEQAWEQARLLVNDDDEGRYYEQELIEARRQLKLGVTPYKVRPEDSGV